jgi:hypothetical protein
MFFNIPSPVPEVAHLLRQEAGGRRQEAGGRRRITIVLKQDLV